MKGNDPLNIRLRQCRNGKFLSTKWKSEIFIWNQKIVQWQKYD